MDRILCAKLEKALKQEGNWNKMEKQQPKKAEMDHREQVQKAVRKEALKRGGRRQISFGEFLLRQIPFMAKELWIIQGSIAAFIFLLLHHMLGGGFPFMEIRHIPLLAGIFAVVLVMAGVPFLVRSYQCRMYEVEMASKMSFTRLLLADLILALAGSAAAFGVCGTLMARGMAHFVNVSGTMVALYFFLPFALSGSGCALILQTVKNVETAARGIGFCEGYCMCLLALLLYLFRVQSWVYETAWIWQGAGAFMVPVSVYSVAKWIKKADSMSGGKTKAA